MKFIVDTMLGTLAKWLRILGYDTIYDPDLTDNNLFFKAHLEKRILLTRDTELSERMNPDFCHYVNEDSVKEQLKQIIMKYNLLQRDEIFTRCTLCNELVVPIQKKNVQNRVPDYIYEVTKEFVYCKQCDKIYWPGSHIKKVRQLLNEIDESFTERNR